MSEFAIRRPVTVLMTCLGIIVLGFIAIDRVPIELMPEIKSTNFTVVTRFSGASPEEVENLVTRPIENSVSTLTGLKRTESTSESGRSEVRLYFRTDVDFLETIGALREQVESASLPDGVSPPEIRRFRPNAGPTLKVGFIPRDNKTNQKQAAQLLQNVLQRRLLKTDGVALVTVSGSPREMIRVRLKPGAALAYRVNPKSVAEMIRSQEQSFSAGQIEYLGRKTPIKLNQSLHSVSDLGNVVVKKEKGRYLRLADIADIAIVVEPPEQQILVNGQKGFLVEVHKEAEANAVSVGERALAVVDSFSEENGSTFESLVITNRSKEIAQAVSGVSAAVMTGAFLAGFLILLFLQKFWPTFIVTASIPLALLISIILMYFTGVTFNLMSLAGMALGVGMLVDNSIVVLENIFRYQSEMDDPKQAALWGTQKVKGAIIASTLSNIAVFGPLTFVEGKIGQLFRDISLTIVYANVGALFIALYVVPMLGSIKMGGGALGAEKKAPFGWRPQGLEQLIRIQQGRAKKPWAFIAPVYSRLVSSLILLRWLLRGIKHAVSLTGRKLVAVFLIALTPIQAAAARFLFRLDRQVERRVPGLLSRPRLTAAAIVGLVGLSVIAFNMKGAELFPDTEAKRLVYKLVFPAGQKIETTERQVQNLVEQVQKVEGVRPVVSRTEPGLETQVELEILLDEGMGVLVDQHVVSLLKQTPGLLFSRQPTQALTSGKPLAFEIFHSDLETLDEGARRAVASLRGVEGLADVSSSLKPNINGLVVEFNKSKLNRFGVDGRDLAEGLRGVLEPLHLNGLNIGGEESLVEVQFPQEFFRTMDQLRFFQSFGEKPIYLDQVANVDLKSMTGRIEHVDRKRMVRVTANIDEVDLKEASQLAQVQLEKELPAGQYKIKAGGQDEERKQTEKSLLGAVALSVFLIYLLLASQFENMRQPLIVLLSVPLCLIGVMVFLIACNVNISAMVFVGFIILVGTSVNSSIVLTDLANQLVLDGRPVREALLEAISRRLRPILMTTGSTIIGLLPLALALGDGAKAQQPLALTVIGGLMSSTILTLVVVPLVYEKLAGERA